MHVCTSMVQRKWHDCFHLVLDAFFRPAGGSRPNRALLLAETSANGVQACPIQCALQSSRDLVCLPSWTVERGEWSVELWSVSCACSVASFAFPSPSTHDWICFISTVGAMESAPRHVSSRDSFIRSENVSAACDRVRSLLRLDRQTNPALPDECLLRTEEDVSVFCSFLHRGSVEEWKVERSLCVRSGSSALTSCLSLNLAFRSTAARPRTTVSPNCSVSSRGEWKVEKRGSVSLSRVPPTRWNFLVSMPRFVASYACCLPQT